jgi:hypothetical protein
MQSIEGGTNLEGRWVLRDSACTSTELRRTDDVLFAVCGREHDDVKVQRAGLVYDEALGITDALDIVVCLDCHWYIGWAAIAAIARVDGALQRSTARTMSARQVLCDALLYSPYVATDAVGCRLGTLRSFRSKDRPATQVFPPS